MTDNRLRRRSRRLLLFLLVEPYDVPVTRDWLFWVGAGVGVGGSVTTALVTREPEPWLAVVFWAWLVTYWLFAIPACGLRAFLRGWHGPGRQSSGERSESVTP